MKKTLILTAATAMLLAASPAFAQGIIVLAVVLYVLLREDAIRSERETFDVEDIRRVARERMATQNQSMPRCTA